MTARAPVPEDGELRLGTVRLPVGRRLRLEDGDGEPVAWRTQAPMPEPGPVWSALSALHGQTGLVPVLEPVGWGDLEDSCREISAVADLDRVDAAAMLEHRWADSFPESWQVGPEWDEDRRMVEGMAAPFTSRYPGLAPAVDAAVVPDVLEAAVRSFPASRIVLVPADRPADVLPVLGWCPGNWDCAFPAPRPVGFAAVLRSWGGAVRCPAVRHEARQGLPARRTSAPRSGRGAAGCRGALGVLRRTRRPAAGADDRRGDHRCSALVLPVGLTDAGIPDPNR